MFFLVFMFSSRQSQSKLLLIKFQSFLKLLTSGFQFISLWIQGTHRELKVYYPKTNSLVSVHQREHRMCYIQASVS